MTGMVDSPETSPIVVQELHETLFQVSGTFWVTRPVLKLGHLLRQDPCDAKSCEVGSS